MNTKTRAHEKIRRHGKVHQLPSEIRKEVDDLLTTPGVTYQDIEEYLKPKGYDISMSSIGRYGKDFLNTYQQLRIIEDQARTLVSDAGEGLTLDEAGGKLSAKMLIEILTSKEKADAMDPKLLAAFASMQKAAVAREKMKQDFDKKKGEFFIDAMKELINWLSKNDPEALPLIERNFDDFIGHAKEKYGIK